MEDSRLSRRHHFPAFAAAFIFVAFVALLVLCVTIDLRYGSNAAATTVAVAVPFWAIWAVMFTRKPSHRANYPRIEHLRIAGKYTSTGAAKIGVSPLHLK
jgi:hypothetical protein